MLKHSVVLTGITILASCATSPTQDFYKGENLLFSRKLPEGKWRVFEGTREDLDVHEIRFESQTNQDLAFLYSYLNTPDANKYRSKHATDRSGEQKCTQSFESEVISTETVNGYPQVTWSSHCQKKTVFNPGYCIKPFRVMNPSTFNNMYLEKNPVPLNGSCG